jgi:hypothetical protein
MRSRQEELTSGPSKRSIPAGGQAGRLYEVVGKAGRSLQEVSDSQVGTRQSVFAAPWDGVSHTVEVTAGTLDEAVANRGLAAIRVLQPQLAYRHRPSNYGRPCTACENRP